MLYMPRKNTKAARSRTGSKRGSRSSGAISRKSPTSSRQKGKTPVNLVIRRTSGRVEKFDSDRMTQVVSRSGTPFMLAKDVSKKVSNKIRRESSALAREVESNKRESSSKA